jgi:uncharacterized membrane protein YhaH (DUF805 family)
MPWLGFFFSFQGRLSRADYWLRSTLAMLLFFVTGIFMLFLFFVLWLGHHDFKHGLPAPLLFIIADFVIYVWALVAIASRRCHDLGFSATQKLSRGLTSLQLSFKRGASGPNAFGPDPLQTKSP